MGALKIVNKYLHKERQYKFPNFHVLPKLHKEYDTLPVTRPISWAINWIITTPISKLINVLLKPLLDKEPVIIKNTQLPYLHM